jgi:putative ABC transport system permease protein
MWGRTRRSDDDFAREIRAHITAEADRLVDEGMSRAQAEATALRTFGNVTRTQERFYESRHVMWLDDARRNLRYSLRMLRQAPGFSAVAVLTLALGIGANTTLFSVLYGVLLKTLPYPDADQIVSIRQNVPSSGYDGLGVSNPQLLRLRDAQNVFSAIGGYGFQDTVLTTATDVEKLTAARVTAGVADVLGAHLQVGRSFRRDDEMPGSEPVAIG